MRSKAADQHGNSNTDALCAAFLSELTKSGGSIGSAVTSSTGEKYTGQLDARGKRHGKGVLRWPNGNCFMGDWREGCMCGTGTFLYGVEGDRYEGEFFDDKKHGQGKYTFANGNFYTGAFHVDKRHGKGRYSWMCGDLYDGEWRDGKMHGSGVTVYSNGNKYEGEFVDDRREGRGKLTCVDGLSYDGTWLQNMRHGSGTLKFPTGDFYQGQWLNDKKHGLGKDVFVNGNVFDGHYELNVKAGRGVMSYANGDKYSGEWAGDKMHGRGVYSFANGFLYDGEWRNDGRNGFGVYTFPNGHRYDGEWKDDKRHGKGVLVLNTCERYQGVWHGGKMEGDFVVSIGSRVIFEGVWKGGVAADRGTYHFHLQSDGSMMTKAQLVSMVRDPSPASHVSAPASMERGATRFTGVFEALGGAKKSDGTIDYPSDPRLLVKDVAFSLAEGALVEEWNDQYNDNPVVKKLREGEAQLGALLNDLSKSLNSTYSTVRTLQQRRSKEPPTDEAQISEELHVTQQQVDKLREEVAGAVAAREAAATETVALKQSISERKERMAVMKSRKEQSKKAAADVERLRQQLKKEQSALHDAELMLEKATQQVTTLQTDADGFRSKLTTVQKDIDALDRDALNRRVQDLDQQVAAAQKKLTSQGSEYRLRLNQLTAARSAAEAALKTAEQGISAAHENKARLLAELAATKSRVAQHAEDANAANARLELLRNRATVLKDEHAGMQNESSVLKNLVAKLQLKVDRQRREITEIQHETQKLSQKDEASVAAAADASRAQRQQKRYEEFRSGEMARSQKENDREVLTLEGELRTCEVALKKEEAVLRDLEAESVARSDSTATPPQVGLPPASQKKVMQQQKQLAELQRQNALLLEDLRGKREHLGKLQREREEIRAQLKEITKEAKRLEKERAKAAPPPESAPPMSLGASITASAGKEAAHHQLIKAKSTGEALSRDYSAAQAQLAHIDQQIAELQASDSLHHVLSSIGEGDWRLKYLADQIEAKGRVIAELQQQTSPIESLEAQLAAANEIIASVQNSSGIREIQQRAAMRTASAVALGTGTPVTPPLSRRSTIL